MSKFSEKQLGLSKKTQIKTEIALRPTRSAELYSGELEEIDLTRITRLLK